MTKFTAALLVAVLGITSLSAFAQARVTVAHFAPFADTIDGTAVDIAVNGDVVLENVKFKDFITEPLEVPGGDHTIDVIPVGATDPAISETFTLTDGVSYFVYAQGNGTTQALELRAMLDDTVMPAEGSLNLRIVHAAPFAAKLEDTEVSIRTAGGDVVNDLVGVPYSVDSLFFPVPSATYDLKVANNSGSINYIDPLPVELPAGFDITVFAVGDGINQPLGIVAFPVGELELRDPVDNSANGIWQITNASGYGFILQPMPSQNRLVGQWYQPDAEGNPSYFFFDSCEEDTNDMGEFECSTPGGFDGVTADTTLFQCLGGSLDMSDMVECSPIGTIEWELPTCVDALATVTIGMDDPVLFEAKQLTLPFPCEDDES
jgi:hypothetical protein